MLALIVLSGDQPQPVAPATPHSNGHFAPEHDLRDLYYKHFGDRRRERQLFSTGSFFLTFAAVRGITHAIRAERGPFRNITPGGRHIHHMTFGITGLLTVGYLWLLEIGINEQRWSSRVTATAYGSGAALTLDEFALWLNLEDDYWTTGPRVDRCRRPVRLAAVTQRARPRVLDRAGPGPATRVLSPAKTPRGSVV